MARPYFTYAHLVVYQVGLQRLSSLVWQKINVLGFTLQYIYTVQEPVYAETRNNYL